MQAHGGAGVVGFGAVGVGAEVFDERVVRGVGPAVRFNAQIGAGGVGPQVDGAGEKPAHEPGGVVVAAHCFAQDGHQGLSAR